MSGARETVRRGEHHRLHRAGEEEAAEEPYDHHPRPRHPCGEVGVVACVDGSFTDKGMPQCNAATIKELAGAINAEDPSKSRFGRAYTAILGEMG